MKYEIKLEEAIELLYENPMLSESVLTASDGVLYVGDHFPANSYNSVSSKAYKTGSEVAPSRILQSFRNPDFEVSSYEAEWAYGYFNINGNKERWAAHRTNVYNKVTLVVTSSAEYAKEPIYLFPFAALLESLNPPLRTIRTAKNITVQEALHYSELFMAFISENIKLVYEQVDEVAKKTACDVNIKAMAPCDLPWFKDDGVPNDLSVASALKGKYRLDFGNSADVLPLSFLEGYIDNPDYRNVMEQVVGYLSSMKRKNRTESFSTLQNVMLVGEPGTGKTALARAVAASFGLPILIIRLGDRSEKDELTQEVRVTDEGFRTVKSRCYDFIKNGGIILWDDISNVDPNMFFSVMGGVFEAPFEYYVGNECVKRNPYSLFLATANIGTVGSEAMNEALLTRFGQHYKVSRLDDESFCKTIETRAFINAGFEGLSSDTLNALTKWVYANYAMAEKLIATYSADAGALLSLRAAIAVEEMALNALANGFMPNLKRYAKQAYAHILYSGGNENIAKSLADAIDSMPDAKLSI